MSKPISNRTPVFPAWRPPLAPLGRRTARICQQIRSQTLCQIEACFAPWIPAHLFPKAPDKENSRDCCYTRWRTFWCMLWQCLNPKAPGREVVRQLQALFGLENGPDISEEDGAFSPLALHAAEPSAGDPSERLLPNDPAERIAVARRAVADRCLYGVDINPMAVEMAKLSLWLITLQRDRPFTFLDHALKCGDSLLGVSSVQQIENFSLRPGDGRSPLPPPTSSATWTKPPPNAAPSKT